MPDRDFGPFVGAIEARMAIADSASGPVITGYAAVYHRDDEPGTEYEIYPGVVERIERGAFKSALERPDDVRALFNHDASRLLGRTSSGTLELRTDRRGLHYTIRPGKTGTSAEVVELVERGDLDGSSFGFRVLREEWIEEEDVTIRAIKDVELLDISPCTYPAYSATTRSAFDRSLEEHRRRVDGRRLDELFANLKELSE